MNRRVRVVLLKVLINWYDKCDVFVPWNNVLSRCFYLMCGVRQGGVLSPLLLSVYVNDMIQKLCDEPHGTCERSVNGEKAALCSNLFL